MRWNTGSVAEWSMALVLGTSLCGGKGSNPFTIKVKITFLNQSHQIPNDNGLTLKHLRFLRADPI